MVLLAALVSSSFLYLRRTKKKEPRTSEAQLLLLLLLLLCVFGVAPVHSAAYFLTRRCDGAFTEKKKLYRKKSKTLTTTGHTDRVTGEQPLNAPLSLLSSYREVYGLPTVVAIAETAMVCLGEGHDELSGVLLQAANWHL